MLRQEEGGTQRQELPALSGKEVQGECWSAYSPPSQS